MDDGLKQRLIGAIVLLAIAVIFIPALFDRKTIVPVDTQSQIPRMPEVKMEPITVAEAPEVESPAPEPTEMFIPAEPVAVASQASVSAPSSTAITSAPKNTAQAPSLKDNGVPVGWVLQVVSFTEEIKANSVRDKLIADKLPAYVRVTETPKGRYFRVYIGPKLDKNAILKDKQFVDTHYKVTSLVLDMTPAK